MENIILAQAAGYKPEVVGQRTIISEEELSARDEKPEVSSFVTFGYVIAGIILLIMAGWAVQKLFAQEKIKPVRKTPPNAPVRTRKIAKS